MSITSRKNHSIKTTEHFIDLEKNVDKVYNYWSKQPFPYPTTKEIDRKKEYEKFMRTNDRSSFDFEERMLDFNNAGLTLCWSYFPHAYEVRCNDLLSPYDVFRSEKHMKDGLRKVLSGTFFNKKSVSEMCSSKGVQTILSILRRVTGSQMVSNFRPVTASMIYKIFCDKGDLVWDMSSGWGGRLLASFKANINYIGTDPSSKTVQSNNELKEDLIKWSKNKYKHIIHKLGSEEYRPEKNSLDFAFTSPPYFNTEKYSNEKSQSYMKFKSINSWKEKFLRKTIQNVHYGLKQNKFMGLNVANVRDYEDFEYDTVKLAKEEGFKLVDTFDLVLSSQHDSYKTEPIFIFKKI